MTITRRVLLINGRDNFPKDFIISVALAAKAGKPVSDALGVYKEIERLGRRQWLFF